MENKPDISKFPKYSPNHYIREIPTALKDPKHYKKIQKLILSTLAGKHSHGEVVDWAKCPECQGRFQERGDFLKKLGFKTPRHYLVWKKVMEEMTSLLRDRLR